MPLTASVRQLGNFIVPITDKNRKILWAKSGNRCAVCRKPLIIEPTHQDPESVLGEECHIRSAAKAGPRHDPAFPANEIDGLSNLLLLCRVHHKMVDDQVETYTTNILTGIKTNHENWVEEKLKDEDKITPVRIKRISDEIPTKLPLILSGIDLLNLALGCHAAYNDYSDDLDDAETDLVGGFIQDISDWADLGFGMEPSERIRAAKSIDEGIKSLRESGFLVFAERERQRIEGGINGPSNFYVLHLSVKRGNDSGVVFYEQNDQS